MVCHRGVSVKPVAALADERLDVDNLPFVTAALATKARVIVTLNPDELEPAIRQGLCMAILGAG